MKLRLSDFAERGQLHNPEPSIEDPAIWWNVLGLSWMKDERIQDMKRALRWNEDVAPKLDGWEQELVQMESAWEQTKMHYGLDPQQGQAMYEQEKAGYEAAKAVELDMRARVEAGQMDPATLPPQPPRPPMVPLYLPTPDLKSHIKQVWGTRLGIDPTAAPIDGVFEAPPETQALSNLIDFFATVCAYQIYAARRKATAMGGSPVVAAPGGASTPSGLEAAPMGEPINPAPGAPMGGK